MRCRAGQRCREAERSWERGRRDAEHCEGVFSTREHQAAGGDKVLLGAEASRHNRAEAAGGGEGAEGGRIMQRAGPRWVETAADNVRWRA
jgi:hypothetical protein